MRTLLACLVALVAACSSGPGETIIVVGDERGTLAEAEFYCQEIGGDLYARWDYTAARDALRASDPPASLGWTGGVRTNDAGDVDGYVVVPADERSVLVEAEDYSAWPVCEIDAP